MWDALLGASLARLTLEIALASSATMIPTMELAVGIDEIEWESAAGLPVVVSLPVVVREK